VYKEAYFNSNDRGPIVPSMDVIFFFFAGIWWYIFQWHS
jgi:hypothetical protein